MIVIVTGGRDYTGTGLVEALNALAQEHKGLAVYVGDGATGADAIARKWVGKVWASGRNMLMFEFHTTWIRYRELFRFGPGSEMVKAALQRPGVPKLCLAAPGEAETADCVRRCREAGFDVREVTA